MNKLVKGSIAGAAGIALLLGGAGTLAYWNDSATIDSAANISTGTLEVAANAGGWSDPAIANYVPGDSNVYTQTFTVTAVGDNLAFEITNNVASLIPTGLDSLTVSQDVTVVDSSSVAVTDISNVEEGVYTVTVEITVDFPFGSAGNQDDQNVTVNLSSAAVTVTQIP